VDFEEAKRIASPKFNSKVFKIDSLKD